MQASNIEIQHSRNSCVVVSNGVASEHIVKLYEGERRQHRLEHTVKSMVPHCKPARWQADFGLR